MANIRELATAAGASLVAGAALFLGGMPTSPAMAGPAKVDYLASPARDPLLTQVLAALLHYGNLALGSRPGAAAARAGPGGVLTAGLARAGVIGWWSLPGVVAGTARLILVPYSTPLLPALNVTPMPAVFVFAGFRVPRRAALG